MASATELPDLVREFTDLSKEYLLQETVVPAKELGRYAGFAVGAAISFAVGALLLGIAGVRLIIEVLPEGPNWSALGYLIATVVLVLLSGLLIRMGAEDRKRNQ
ncbi:MAG: hypothetical protein HKN91_14965 [Acidimicrobiia bacterium]|nr:hypothetical protein [Acidimicrobiia bacterium]